MKPPPFDYVAARSLDQALDVLARRGGDAKILAGGQSLIPVLNFRLARPAVLVDLNPLADLDFVRVGDDGGLTVGALARQRRLERDDDVARLHPLLTETASWIAHPQIRNRGTVGGSLAHADPAAELPAVALALDARFHLRSHRGTREVEAADFFTGLFATALEPNEILTEITFPALSPRTGCAFDEIARRHGDYAQAGGAAVVTLRDDGTVDRARLAFLSLGDGPVLATRAAAVLEGETPSDDLFAAVADAVTDPSHGEIDPTGDIHATTGYKRHLAGVLTRRVLARAVERAGAPS